MYEIFKIANLHAFHVWEKRILSCNDTTYFLHFFFFCSFYNPIFSTPVTSSNPATKIRYLRSSTFYREPIWFRTSGYNWRTRSSVRFCSGLQVTTTWFDFLVLSLVVSFLPHDEKTFQGVICLLINIMIGWIGDWSNDDTTHKDKETTG